MCSGGGGANLCLTCRAKDSLLSVSADDDDDQMVDYAAAIVFYFFYTFSGIVSYFDLQIYCIRRNTTLALTLIAA